VRSGKAAGRDDQSRPFVSSIHALPLALSKTYDLTCVCVSIAIAVAGDKIELAPETFTPGVISTDLDE